MSGDRAVESESQQAHSQAVRSSRAVRYGNHYTVSRPRSSPWPQSFTPAALAHRFAQLKSVSAQVSRSVFHYPYWWLGATWLVLVGVGGVAAVTLLTINPAEPPVIAAAPSEIASTPLPDQPPAQSVAPQQRHNSLPEGRSTPDPEQSKASLPLFALGSVALSCAIGCLWLSYRFKAPSPRQQPRFPARPQRLPRPVAEAPAAISRSSPRSTVAAPTSDPVSTVSTTAVTIVSSIEDHPLDWQEPSLADNLDIRQQRPLSRWL